MASIIINGHLSLDAWEILFACPKVSSRIGASVVYYLLWNRVLQQGLSLEAASSCWVDFCDTVVTESTICLLSSLFCACGSLIQCGLCLITKVFASFLLGCNNSVTHSLDFLSTMALVYVFPSINGCFSDLTTVENILLSGSTIFLLLVQNPIRRDHPPSRCLRFRSVQGLRATQLFRFPEVRPFQT